jgi:4a-hydroxytetrahydrobiopterin dehydratase
MLPLANKTCVPCRGDVPALKGRGLKSLHAKCRSGRWSPSTTSPAPSPFRISATRWISSNRVGELAEQQGHHPDILLAWGKAEVTLWTHKTDGLTESDFIMAAKIDRLYRG